MFQFTRNERKNFFKKKEMTVHQIKKWRAHYFARSLGGCFCWQIIDMTLFGQIVGTAVAALWKNAGQGRTIWLEACLDEDGRLPEKTTTTKVNRRAKERSDNLLLRKSQFVRRAWLPNKTTFSRYVSESLSFEYITGAIVASLFFEVLLAELLF